MDSFQLWPLGTGREGHRDKLMGCGLDTLCSALRGRAELKGDTQKTFVRTFISQEMMSPAPPGARGARPGCHRRWLRAQVTAR